MIRALEKLLAPLKRRVRLMVSRATVKSADDSTGLQQVQVSALADEVLDRVERLQEYGFTSVPLPGGSALIVCVGGSRSHPVAVATDDARHRPTGLAAGEVAIYTDEGDIIKLKRGHLIEIVAATKVTITAPTVEIAGNLAVSGSVSDGTGTMAAMRSTYNTHTHSDPQGGATGGPSATMS